ncbi:hypothetical protein BLNAU_20209 [Blattamonas nauphoetae]|uniref:Ubiquitin-like domain-containing protein n=1 Tax=Blattamonas nauphoetae TaxID=2049346 RepID=A0ABQ9WZB0_9EUKA|nr:hypothetical protein BLNAU_20209 [Blattamonas nauphoetae]
MDENTRLKAHFQLTDQVPEVSKEAVDNTIDFLLFCFPSSKVVNQTFPPHTTILQIKHVLTCYLNVSPYCMTIVFVADELSDSTTLSEISFTDVHQLNVIVNESNNHITVTINYQDHEKQKVTLLRSDNVDELRRQIATLYNLHPSSIQIVHDGRSLIDFRHTIEQDGIHDGSDIFIIRQILG